MPYAGVHADTAESAGEQRGPGKANGVGSESLTALAGLRAVSAIRRTAGNAAANRFLRTGAHSASRVAAVQRQQLPGPPARGAPTRGSESAAEPVAADPAAVVPEQPLPAARRLLVAAAAAGVGGAGDDDRPKQVGAAAQAPRTWLASPAPVPLQRLAGDHDTDSAEPRPEPADESVELPTSDGDGGAPTSVMVGDGGGGGGGGSADGGTGGGSPTDSPERQAEQIVADGGQSEQQTATSICTRYERVNAVLTNRGTNTGRTGAEGRPAFGGRRGLGRVRPCRRQRRTSADAAASPRRELDDELVGTGPRPVPAPGRLHLGALDRRGDGATVIVHVGRFR